jgi:glutathione-regulated potassium-efflux system ancillary protein KefG
MHAPARRLPARRPAAPDARVLVLYVHPAPHRSRVNAQMRVAAESVQGVTVHDLYEQYPDFNIDIGHEQALLAQHHAVVFQHPMYWYSMPAMLKEWIDHVLAHGWAYGRGGDALRGKRLMSAISAGGPASAYDGGPDRPTIRALFEPIAKTARLCGMTYLPPFITYGSHRADDDALGEVAAGYARVLAALRDERAAFHARDDGSLEVPRLAPEVH